MRTWMGVVGLALALAGCSGKGGDPDQPGNGVTSNAPASAAPARCDGAKIARVVGALEKMKGGARDEMALMGLFGACSQPTTVSAVLQGITTSTPAVRRSMVERTVRENATLWATACPGGASTFNAWRAAQASARFSIVWSGCQLGRFGFARAEELKGDPPYLLPAVFYAAVMTDAKVNAAHRRVMLRALVGLR